jgi:hypothetical protein
VSQALGGRITMSKHAMATLWLGEVMPPMDEYRSRLDTRTI